MKSLSKTKSDTLRFLIAHPSELTGTAVVGKVSRRFAAELARWPCRRHHLGSRRRQTPGCRGCAFPNEVSRCKVILKRVLMLLRTDDRAVFAFLLASLLSLAGPASWVHSA